MFNKLTQSEMITLEGYLDTMGVDGLLELMSDICHEKSAHIAANWQDEVTARIWSRRAARLNQLADRILFN